MRDELRMIIEEGSRSEKMIRVHMRQHDIAHWKCCDPPNGIPQCPANSERAAGIDGQHAFVADDETDVRVIAEIVRGALIEFSVMNVIAGCSLADVELLKRCACTRGRRQDG